MNNLKGKLQNTKADNETMAERNSSHLKNIQRLQEEVDAKNQKVFELEEQVIELTGTNEKNEKLIETMKTKNQDLSKDVDQNQEKLDEFILGLK